MRTACLHIDHASGIWLPEESEGISGQLCNSQHAVYESHVAIVEKPLHKTASVLDANKPGGWGECPQYGPSNSRINTRESLKQDFNRRIPNYDLLQCVEAPNNRELKQARQRFSLSPPSAQALCAQIQAVAGGRANSRTLRTHPHVECMGLI